MKKVAIDCRLIGKEISGIAKYLLMMLKGLIEIGDLPFDISLIVNDPKEDKKRLLSYLGLDHIPFKIIHSTTKVFSIKDQFLLPDLLKNNKIDVFYSPYFGIPFVCDARTISTFHDLIPILHPVYVAGTRKGRFHTLFRILNYLVVKRSRHIVVVSETTRNDFFKHYGISYESKLSVVYEGIEALKTSQQISNNVEKAVTKKPYILYVGRQDPYKNLTGLLKAFKEVKDKIYGVNLVIAGKKDPRFYPELFELLKRLNLDRSVSFTGYVNEADLELLYSNAKLLVNPSKYEGFGLTPLEGFLRGCPAAVSNIPINKEVLENSVLYFNPDNVKDMAEKLSVFIQSESERTIYVERCKQKVLNYTCKKAAQSLLEVFAKTLK
ncbi:MAG: glycosyltransferase family 4 protein [Candidatus Aureabacteria bacterium]|nr:glycosyltransferase family 4 protein [Candidatus Auribacterota bacterium]